MCYSDEMKKKLEHERQDGWRKHLRISGYFSPIERAILESECDKLYREVPEFREMLPDAKRSLTDRRDGKILIRPPTRKEKEQGIGGKAWWPYGIIMVDLEWLNTAIYQGEDRQTHPLTLRRLLFHELAHLADPALEQQLISVTAEKNRISKQSGALLRQIPRKGWTHLVQNVADISIAQERLRFDTETCDDLIIEPYIRRKTNRVMFRHYDEPFRIEGDESMLDFLKASNQPIKANPVHGPDFIPLPILDEPDPTHLRAELVEDVYKEHPGFTSWQEQIEQQQHKKNGPQQPPRSK